jgi:hypothetical protein
MSNTNSNYTNYLNTQLNSSSLNASANSGYALQNQQQNYSYTYSNSFSNNSQAQARSLWIGEIDPWMDEGFMASIFQEVGMYYK